MLATDDGEDGSRPDLRVCGGHRRKPRRRVFQSFRSQSIGVLPTDTKNAFVFEKGLLPKKPL